MRLAHKTKCLNDAGFAILSEKLIEIGKMIGGWIKHTNTPHYCGVFADSSGENGTHIRPIVVRPVPVHVRTLGVKFTKVDQVAVGRKGSPFLPITFKVTICSS
ncbi:MAG: four helix bundle protein [Candidatus Vogelbacteria bacterium]|nr:four helix bundle protein [Candidatus Vogelbacteria bacterium]